MTNDVKPARQRCQKYETVIFVKLYVYQVKEHVKYSLVDHVTRFFVPSVGVHLRRERRAVR